MDISKLRPWEYDAMSFWDYERISHAQHQWQEARRVLPPMKAGEKAPAQPLPIREDGTGPQFA